MSPAFAIAQKDLRLLVRDKGALFWAGLFPLVFAVLFGAIQPGGATKVTLAATDEDRSVASMAVLAGAAAAGVNLERVDAAEAEARMRRGEAIAAIRIPEGFARGAPLELAIDPSHATEGAYLETALTRGLSRGCAPAVTRRTLATHTPRSGFELAFPAAILWGLIGCAGAFAAASMAERRSGTHLRLRAAPVRPYALLLGKLLAVLFACVVNTTALVAIAWLAFDVRVERFSTLPVVVAACAVCFSGLTVLLGVLGRSEQSVGGASWATLLLMAMFGGGMVPLSAMPGWMRAASAASPVRWGIAALEGATFRGLTLGELARPCSILLAFGLGALALGALRARSEA